MPVTPASTLVSPDNRDGLRDKAPRCKKLQAILVMIMMFQLPMTSNQSSRAISRLKPVVYTLATPK
jgi:hypothetical protein